VVGSDVGGRESGIGRRSPLVSRLVPRVGMEPDGEGGIEEVSVAPWVRGGTSGVDEIGRLGAWFSGKAGGTEKTLEVGLSSRETCPDMLAWRGGVLPAGVGPVGDVAGTYGANGGAGIVTVGVSGSMNGPPMSVRGAALGDGVGATSSSARIVVLGA
jgi:hypothetical protein